MVSVSRKVDILQNTPEWLAWRKLGGSDSSVLMGVNPWCGVEELWKRKLGLLPEITVNAAMQRGHDLEPEARVNLELDTGLILPAACYERTDYPFMTASLDGISVNEKIMSEIKCPGLKTHNAALLGKVPAYYVVQCQHNMMVSGAELCLYYSYTDLKEENVTPLLGNEFIGRQWNPTVLIEIPRDEDFCKRIMKRCKEFWPYVESKTAPNLSLFAAKDAGNLNGTVRTDPAFKMALDELLGARTVLLDAKAQYKGRAERLEQLLSRKKQVVVVSEGVRIERQLVEDKWKLIISEVDE
jgi:putative phage-type endonuclease